MDLSVIIVTYGRNEDCRDAIESILRGEDLPREIIVVDDHPTEKFSYENPIVKVIHTEREIGISACRNLGIKISKGDVIAFLDDDVVVDKLWAREIINCFKDLSVGMVFGKINPLYLAPLPKWWDEEKFSWAVSVNKPAGANFVVRKTVFEEVGNFKEELGIIKGKRFNLEDIEFRKRAEKICKVVFCEKALVYHKVPPYRLSRRYILRRYYSEGRGRRILGTYKTRDAVKGILYSLIRFPRFHAVCNLVLWLGYLFG